MTKKILSGKVIKDKNDKTIVVLVKRKYSHPFFNKVMTATKKYHAHDKANKFKIGAIAGYTHFVGDSFKAPGVNVKVNDAGFLPIGITSRFIASNKSTLALDFGYAIGFSRGLSGGVFFAPKLYYNLSKTFDAFVSYKSIAVSNYDFGAICFGVEFKL